MAGLVVPAYLAGDNPRAQSGHSGDAQRWEGARRLLLDAVDPSGTFLDIGCANGHLFECVDAWATEDGIDLEPWGLEISAELAELARRRLPHWRDRIAVGNALDWRPAKQFTYVRTNLDYAPDGRREASCTICWTRSSRAMAGLSSASSTRSWNARSKRR